MSQKSQKSVSSVRTSVLTSRIQYTRSIPEEFFSEYRGKKSHCKFGKAAYSWFHRFWKCLLLSEKMASRYLGLFIWQPRSSIFGKSDFFMDRS